MVAMTFTVSRRNSCFRMDDQRSRALQAMIISLCTVLGLVLRIVIFPHGLSPMETDEPGYLSDGLQIIEGVTSGHKYAPSGPLTWFGTLYAGGRALLSVIPGDPDVSGFPTLLRPVAALEASLFRLYSDMSGMRLAAVSLIVVLMVISIAAISRFGYRIAGPLGALVAGLLAASLPTFIELSIQTRPYAISWALALIALAAAGAGRERWATIGSGIFIGLATGSHIDMLRVGPLILLLQWRRAKDGAIPWRDFMWTIASAAISFILIAPWYLLHLIDNVRQILSVRVLVTGAPPWFEWWDKGVAIPGVVTIIGLLLAALRCGWPEFWCGVWLFINVIAASRPSSHGLHHDGAVLVAIVAMAPLALLELRRLFPATVLVVFIAGPTIVQGVIFSLREFRSKSEDKAIAWVEQNVPAGTRVYAHQFGSTTLLPSAGAAERLWADVANPDAWIPKYISDTSRLGLGGSRPLRVMSDDRLASDRGYRRRFYILGAPLQADRPRYELWLISEGSFYDLSTSAAVDRLCRDGGIFLHKGDPIPGLPVPVVSWPKTDNGFSMVYRVAPGDCGGK
jgi:hypothetical protein